METIRKILFYGGLTPQDYEECRADICADNRRKLRAYLSIAIGILFLVTCLSGGLRALRRNSMFYGIAFVVCIALLAIEMAFPEENGLLLKWLMYAYAALLYTLGIVVALSNPDELSVSFIAFSLAVPLLFVMPPIQHITNVMFFDIVFIVMVSMKEADPARTVDIVDTVVFGAVSCIISTIMMQGLYQNFLSRLKLRAIANYDILTGVKNRNAYENERKSWAEKCSVSLSCVYVDVNGLHELNNSSGHEKGDLMLQVVAEAMRGVFGGQHCYRTGGDEFVAFVLDQQDAAVRSTVDEMTRALAEKGYSVAVGVATHSAGGIGMKELIKTAEKRMYLAKEEHYRALNQNGR